MRVLVRESYNNGYGCSCCRRDWEETEWEDIEDIPFEKIVEEAFNSNAFDGGIVGKMVEHEGKELYGYGSSIYRAVTYTYIQFHDGTTHNITTVEPEKKGDWTKQQVLAYYESKIKPEEAIKSLFRKDDFESAEFVGKFVTVKYDIFSTFDLPGVDDVDNSLMYFANKISAQFPEWKAVGSKYNDGWGELTYERNVSVDEEVAKGLEAFREAAAEKKRLEEEEKKRKAEEARAAQEARERAELARLKEKYGE